MPLMILKEGDLERLLMVYKIQLIRCLTIVLQFVLKVV